MLNTSTFIGDVAYNTTAEESAIIKYVAFSRIILYNGVQIQIEGDYRAN